MLRHLRFFILIVLACALTACEVHDYWAIPSVLHVNGEERLSDELEEPLKDDLFVRYQLDYTITNTSSEDVEVVVAATSYINSFQNVTGQKVWRLEPNESKDGIISSAQLHYGNALNVRLECCIESACARNEVACPQGNVAQTPASDIASFCYAACELRDECIDECPADLACEEYCEEKDLIGDKCNEVCEVPGSLKNCELYCGTDEDCLFSCYPYSACEAYCNSQSITCFKNCLSVYNQCTDLEFENNSEVIPCELCGGTGRCAFNDEKSDEYAIVGEDGSRWECGEPDCSHYPAACLSGCRNLFDDDESTMICVDRCLQQHLYWCNDFTIPSDYVVSSGTAPCCYSESCNAELVGIVKTMDVECFNDTSCSSNHYCSDEGVCKESNASSCAFALNRSPRLALLLAVFVFGFLALRRKEAK